MFGSSNNKDSRSAADSSSSSSSRGGSGSVNTINSDTTIEGTINAKTDIRVDGTIKGNLNCEAKLIIGPQGRIEGEVVCENAVIEGSFKGNLRVKDMLNLRETANVEGDVQTMKIAMQPGCVFNVTCSMGNDKRPLTSTNSSTAGNVNKLKEKEERAKATA
ncbi:MAG: polymer-forming cytoskeletal protein [Saprospiraceae bacterium]